MKYSFEKLDVWNKSKDFAVRIYRIKSEFPKDEKFGLISQIRRASVSVSSNIAEGSSRVSGKDQGRFYSIAYSSAIEVLNQLMISKELNFLNDKDYEKLRADMEHITAMINKLYNSVQNK